MAKRFNVSIPDALAERMEPFKDKLSLSALMQASIERELARLTTSDADKERRITFRANAISAWIKRYPIFEQAINLFVDELINQAVSDSLTSIFDYYRALYIGTNKHLLKPQLEEWAARNPNLYLEDVWSIDSLFDDVNVKAQDFTESLVSFLEDARSKGKEILDDYCYVNVGDENNEKWCLRLDIRDYLIVLDEEVEDSAFARWYLAILEARVKDVMPEADIKRYVTDFDPAGFLWEGGS